MNKTWIAGDLHGHYLALKQCLERAEFDYDNDTLIQLGDICDGWAYVYECLDELYKIRNLILIKGNHDEWFKQWIDSGIHPERWKNGGAATAKSYLKKIDKEHMIQPRISGYTTALNPGDIPDSHKYLLDHQLNYYIDENNNLFIHGGFNRHFPIKDQSEYIYYWDRDLWNEALSYESMNEESKAKNKFKIKNNFKAIFIGHTATTSWDYDHKNIGDLVGVVGQRIVTPMKAANIINLDTGCGFNGKLTFMNVETKEIVQSDFVKDLYPKENGR